MLWGERYEVLEKLGEGGMGCVFRARDHKSGRIVAVKELSRAPPEHRDEALSRFRREARNQARLDHPHLISFLDTGTRESGNPFLVMEYIQGTELSSLLKARGQVPLEFAQRILDEVGSGLDALHQAGILHRDLKPENIMLREGDGSAVIMDLGLARSQHDTLLTRTGDILGTPFYLAPEVVLGGPWTPASDHFQLGAVLYEMLCGYRLVEAYDMEGVLRALATGAWRPLPGNREDLSPALRAVVEQAVSLSPEERFSSARALTEAFRAASRPGSLERLGEKLLALSPRSLGGAVGAVLLGLGIGVLGSGGATDAGRGTPEGIRFRVAGEHLAVHLRPMGARGIALRVGEQEIPLEEEARPDQLVILRAPGALSRGEVSARLVWEGGESQEFRTGPSRPALGESLQLAPRHCFRAEVYRPVSMSLPGGRATLLAPGTRFFPAPPLPGTGATLSWGEEGFGFQRPLDGMALQRDLLDRLRGMVGSASPEEILRSQSPTRLQFLSGAAWEVPGEGFERERARLRPYGSWVPEILGGPLPPEERGALLGLWQRWDETALVEVLLGREARGLEIPQGRVGSRWTGPPPGDAVALPLEEGGGTSTGTPRCPRATVPWSSPWSSRSSPSGPTSISACTRRGPRSTSGTLRHSPGPGCIASRAGSTWPSPGTWSPGWDPGSRRIRGASSPRRVGRGASRGSESPPPGSPEVFPRFPPGPDTPGEPASSRP